MYVGEMPLADKQALLIDDIFGALKRAAWFVKVDLAKSF